MDENIAKLGEVLKTGSKIETPTSTRYAPTGSFLMDIVVGGGIDHGYPFGRIINLVGDKSSGKTFLACELIAACYHKYGKDTFKWVYDDSESGFTFDTEHLYGFEIMPTTVEERTRSNTVEDAYVNVRRFAESLKKNQFGVYVIDSLDGLTSKESDDLADERFKAANKGKEFDKGSYKMGKAKYLSQEFFPQLADLLEKTNCLLVIVSQVRDNIDPMSFERYVRAGGKAMDFYCHSVLWLANIDKIKKKGRAVGITVKAKTTKSKTPRPFREMYFELRFDYGLDDTSTCVDFLFDFRTPKGELTKDLSASWEGGEINLESVKKFLADNGVEEEYRATVKPKLKLSEVVEWIESNDKLAPIFKKKFELMERDDLINFIEDNGLKDELYRRVEEKWESIEASIATSRKPKYN